MLSLAGLAQTADVYVSPSGNDSTGTGSLTNPYATMNQARTAIDNLISTDGCAPSGRTTPYIVMFRGGTYYMGTPGGQPGSTSGTRGTATFTTSDNGCSASQPVIYENYPGETPILDGGYQPPGTWSTPGTITCSSTCTEYQISLAGASYFENLWYSGVRRLRPRLYSAGAAFPGNAYVGSYFTVNAPKTVGSNTATNINCAGSASPYTCVDRFVYNSTDLSTPTGWLNYMPSSNNPCGIPEGGTTAQEGDVEVLSIESDLTSKQRISCLDIANHIIYLTGATYYPNNYASPSSAPSLVPQHSYQVGHRYVVENVKSMLGNVAQQWFLDVSTSPYTLTYLAATGENPTTNVVIPQLPMIITGNGLKYAIFRGLTIEHDNWTVPWSNTGSGYGTATYPYQDGYADMRGQVDFSYTSGNFTNNGMLGAFTCLQCQSVTFEFNTVTQTAGGGVDFYTSNTSSSTQNINIHDNALLDLGGFGIRVGMLNTTGCNFPGGPPCASFNPGTDTDSNMPHNITIFNNLIDGYGRVIPGAIGIMLGSVHDTITEHNDITDGYHAGYNLCALGCLYGNPTSGNYHGAANNLVSWNHIWNIMQGMSGDGGTLYLNTGTAQSGGFQGQANIVANNLVHDTTDNAIFDGYSSGTAGGGQGIYLDANSGNILVANNVVYRVSEDTMFLSVGPYANGSAHLIQNNIFAFGRKGLSGHSTPAWYSASQCPTVPPESAVILGFYMLGNLFYFDKTDTNSPAFYVQQGCSSICGGTNYTDLEKWDRNVFYRTDGNFGTYTLAFHNQTTQTPACLTQPSDWTYGLFSAWQGSLNGLTMGEDPNGSGTFNLGGASYFNSATSATFTGTLGMSPGFGFNYSQTNSTVTNAGRVNPVLYPTIPTIQATFNVDSYSTSDF
jgi:hypothetical protein